MVAAMAILTTRAPGRAWSLPNVLTYGRVAAVPVVVALLFWPDEDWMRWAALGVFAAAGITDFFDGYLARAWARADLTAAARRAAIFELWDDAAETGTADELAAGEAVRTEVIGFVRAHLPAGGADAFTADELAALNARRLSKQRFEPY